MTFKAVFLRLSTMVSVTFTISFAAIFVRKTHTSFLKSFFFIRFSFTDTDDSQDSREREGAIFYSTLPLPPAHEHSDIYLQLCMWDDYHIFLIAPLVFTRLLLDEIFTLSNYHLIDWWCEVCFSLFTWWFDTRFLLQQSWYGKPVDSSSHRLTKCASHPWLAHLLITPDQHLC